jgi:hypothetical protein
MRNFYFIMEDGKIERTMGSSKAKSLAFKRLIDTFFKKVSIRQ